MVETATHCHWKSTFMQDPRVMRTSESEPLWCNVPEQTRGRVRQIRISQLPEDWLLRVHIRCDSTRTQYSDVDSSGSPGILSIVLSRIEGLQYLFTFINWNVSNAGDGMDIIISAPVNSSHTKSPTKHGQWNQYRPFQKIVNSLGIA